MATLDEIINKNFSIKEKEVPKVQVENKKEEKIDNKKVKNKEVAVTKQKTFV